MSICVSIISAVVIFGSIAVLAYQILYNSGVKLPYQIPSKISICENKHTPTRHEYINIFIYSMLFRLFVIAAAFIGDSLMKNETSAFNFKNINSKWRQWDVTHYINISDSYTTETTNGDYSTLVFFPLYSWLLKIVKIFIHEPVIAGLLLSSVLISAACIYFYKMMCIDYSRNTAEKAVILFTIFPFSFFQGSVMTESVFLLTSLMTLYYGRRHNWTAAGICGCLSALSRSAGVFLIIPLTVEFVEEYKLLKIINKPGKLFKIIGTKWSWLLLIPLGTIIYLFINYRITGNPFYFLEMESKYWFQESQPFFKTAGNFINIISGKYSVSTLFSSFLPGFVCLLCSYALLVFGLNRHRSMYMVWLVVYIIINTTMSWPLSFCRYISCAVPLYIILADMCENNKKLYTALLMSWGILFGIYLVGYVTTHQLM